SGANQHTHWVTTLSDPLSEEPRCAPTVCTDQVDILFGEEHEQVAQPQSAADFSTSQQVERLASGASMIVHSTIHPVLGPNRGSEFFPHAYYRQSTAPDLGAMAQRSGTKYLVLTHLIPALGADRQGPFKIPGGPLADADYKKAVRDGGFTGHVLVGTDLASIRLPAREVCCAEAGHDYLPFSVTSS